MASLTNHELWWRYIHGIWSPIFYASQSHGGAEYRVHLSVGSTGISNLTGKVGMTVLVNSSILPLPLSAADKVFWGGSCRWFRIIIMFCYTPVL